MVREHKTNDGGIEGSLAYYQLRLLLRMLIHSSRAYDIFLLAHGEMPNAFMKLFPDPKIVS